MNRNAIPYDSKPPRVTSGLRVGTPYVTSRGFGPREMAKVAHLILRTLEHLGNEAVEHEIREDVMNLTSQFQAPGIDM